ncbi:MAG: hypothetical protein GY791_16080 [Alphaproteobacteria bacterium]|nr:hypothetical protein [Alphaproteobacteria bacterium]
MRIFALTVAVLCIAASPAAAEKSCEAFFSSIPGSYVASVNHHLEVPAVAWLKWGGEYGRGVASVYQVEVPDLNLETPITRLLCARLEEGRYDSPGLSYDLKIGIDGLKLTGFSKSVGALTNQDYFRCLDIDRCAIEVKGGE